MTDVKTFSYLNSWKLEFVNQTYKSLNKSVIELTTPNITIGTIEQQTPIKPIIHVGETVSIEPITLTFLLDEDFQNYVTVMNWLNSLKNFHEVNSNKQDLSEINIHFLNNKMNSNRIMVLEDCFPTTLSDITLQIQMTENTPITFTSTFVVNNIHFI